MRTLTTTIGRAVFVAGAILLLCVPAVAQEVASPPDQIVAQVQQQDMQHEPWWRRWFRRHRKPQPPPTTTPPATTTTRPATTTPPPPAPAPAPAPITTGRLMDKTYFGLHMHHGDTTTPWPQATFGFLRLWDSNTGWRNLQPARGQWDFTRLDKLVALAEQHGVDVVLTLGSTPQWASARPTESCPYGSIGCSAEPANIADWQNYVRTVATRYKGRIHYYEIWNEPTFARAYRPTDFFSGTPAKLVEMASVAYASIKQVDPNAKVLSPGFIGDVAQIEPFFQAGGAKTFDIFAAHYYTPAMPEDLRTQSVLVELKQYQALLAKYGLSDKPMWDTEWGYYHAGTGALDMQTAAAYTARHLVLGAAGGLERSALYAWDNGLLGQVDATTYQMNAQGIAYETVANWLIGSRLQGCTTISSTTWQCEITRDARRAWVVWNTAGPAAIQASSALPAPIEETITLDGRATTVGPAAQITIGIAPMLLKSDVLAW